MRCVRCGLPASLCHEFGGEAFHGECWWEIESLEQAAATVERYVTGPQARLVVGSLRRLAAVRVVPK